MTKDSATPSEPHNAATAVAVVRCFDGNQDADKSGGAAWVTGPASPFSSWPAPMDLGQSKTFSVYSLRI